MIPKNFNGQDPANVITKQLKAFESLSVILKSNGVVSPKKLTVFEYYNTLQYYEKKNRSESNHLNGHKKSPN
jgi:hypothetical protein